MNQFIYQEDTDYPTGQSFEIPFYPTVQSFEIPFSPPTFHMNTGKCTKSLPNGVHFRCFPPLVLTPQKVASLYVHPIDLNNCEQNSEDNLKRR